MSWPDRIIIDPGILAGKPVIRYIPSRHQIKAAATRKALAEIERMLSELRARYDTFFK